jgi:hypothetical protein
VKVRVDESGNSELVAPVDGATRDARIRIAAINALDALDASIAPSDGDMA